MSKKVSQQDPAKEHDETYMEAYLIGKLVDARCANGLTQEQLAGIVGMKQSAVARLETLGSRPRIDTMIKLLKPLGYTLEVVPIGEKVPAIAAPAEKKETKKKAEAPKSAPAVKKIITEEKPAPEPEQPKRIIRRQQQDFSVDWD